MERIYYFIGTGGFGVMVFIVIISIVSLVVIQKIHERYLNPVRLDRIYYILRTIKSDNINVSLLELKHLFKKVIIDAPPIFVDNCMNNNLAHASYYGVCCICTEGIEKKCMKNRAIYFLKSAIESDEPDSKIIERIFDLKSLL